MYRVILLAITYIPFNYIHGGNRSLDKIRVFRLLSHEYV